MSRAAPHAQDSAALFSAGECRSLADEVLALATADETQVVLTDSDTSYLRFASNEASASAQVRERSIQVRSSFGARSAVAQANQLDREALQLLVRRSEDLARRAPEDPEFVSALGAQEYPPGPPQSEEEPDAGPALAGGVRRCIADARAEGLAAAGFVEDNRAARAIANSSGLFGYHRVRVAHFSETARTSDGRGSGWGTCAASRPEELDFEGVSRVATHKARESAATRPLASGTYPAVLEADCVASLLTLLVRSMGAREADEGRSFFARSGGTRLGETLFPSWVTLRSDPAHERVPSVPWSTDGTPHRATEWVKGGAVSALSASRYWAGKSGRAALPSAPNLIFEGGAGGAQDLVHNLERGILVTNLWYVRSLDPRTLLFTGLTRDGVFWVEGGEIRYPVTNFRWNDSPARILGGAQEAGAPVRVGGRGGDNRSAFVPPLRVAEFTLSSVSEAV